MCARGRGQPADRHRQPHQRPQQNIGEDQIVGRPREARALAPAARTKVTRPVRLSRALARAASPRPGRYRSRQRARGNFRRRDRQHAGAGADVEHAAQPPPLGQIVERHQAAARGAVVAGAEGERRLDLDSDVVRLTRARSCAPCTMKRPARTGLSPARLCLTQSCARPARWRAPPPPRRRPRARPARASRLVRRRRGNAPPPAIAIVALEGRADGVVGPGSRRESRRSGGRSAHRRPGGRRGGMRPLQRLVKYVLRISAAMAM